jgi:hypothetical protein
LFLLCFACLPKRENWSQCNTYLGHNPWMLGMPINIFLRFNHFDQLDTDRRKKWCGVAGPRCGCASVFALAILFALLTLHFCFHKARLSSSCTCFFLLADSCPNFHTAIGI